MQYQFFQDNKTDDWKKKIMAILYHSKTIMDRKLQVKIMSFMR